jgi:hypothetical protein
MHPENFEPGTLREAVEDTVELLRDQADYLEEQVERHFGPGVPGDATMVPPTEGPDDAEFASLAAQEDSELRQEAVDPGAISQSTIEKGR